APCGGPLGDVINGPSTSIKTLVAAASAGVGHTPAVNYSRQSGIRRRRPAKCRQPERHSSAVLRLNSGPAQDSIMRAAYGCRPARRTGLTVTLPALLEASSIRPPPRYSATC